MSDETRKHPPVTAIPDPPVAEWERQGALSEFARVAHDLQHDDADRVIARLGRLTQGQREAVADAMERMLDLGA